MAITYGPSHVSSLPVDRDARSYASVQRAIMVVIYTIAGMWLGSEFLGWKLGFPKAFADATIVDKLYYPWMVIWPGTEILTHTFRAGLAGAEDLRRDLYEAYAFIFLGFVFGIVSGVKRYNWALSVAKPASAIHGSARWARPIDVAGTGMLPPTHPEIARALAQRAKQDSRVDPRAVETMKEWMAKPGIYLGEYRDPHTNLRYWLRDTSDRHCMLYAPTRSGKGVSTIIPTVLTWSESIVVNDPKGEIFALTAGYRRNKMRQRVFKFDPTKNDGSSCKINPLDFIRINTEYEVVDAANIGQILVDPQAIGLETGGDSDHWRKASLAFMQGLLLHVKYSREIPQERKNLAGVDAFLSNPKLTLRETLQTMAKYAHDPDFARGWQDLEGSLTATCPTVSAAAKDMLDRDDRERASVLSSVKTYLALYRETILADVMESSDFSIEDLMRGDRPVSLYLVNNPDNMERLRPVMRLITNLIVTAFTGSMEFTAEGRPKPNYQHKMLLVYDELTSTLGKMAILANAIAFLAGYGIKALFVVQDLTQLADTYGDKGAKSLISNMHTHIFFATNNPETASDITKMLGSETVRHETRAWNGGKVSRSEQLAGVSLLSPDQVQSMPDREAVVMVQGHPPIACHKIIYYQEDSFTNRIMAPPESPDYIPVEQRAFNRGLPSLEAAARERAAIRRTKALALSARLNAEKEAKSSHQSFRDLLMSTNDEEEAAAI